MTSKLNWHYLGIYFGDAIAHPIQGGKKIAPASQKLEIKCRATLEVRTQSNKSTLQKRITQNSSDIYIQQ